MAQRKYLFDVAGSPYYEDTNHPYNPKGSGISDLVDRGGKLCSEVKVSREAGDGAP